MRPHALLLPIVLLAACDAGIVSPPKLTEADAAARPAASVTALTATTVSAVRIDLVWPDNVGNETGWEIHRSTAGATGSFSLLATYGANVVQHTDGGLAPLTEYCYKVRSWRRQGNKTTYAAFSNTACSRTLAPPLPAAPSGVIVKPLDGEGSFVGIGIWWTDNSSDETRFDIEAAPSPQGPWTFAGERYANSTSTALYNVPRETQLCYRVFARRDTVRSEPSNADCTSYPNAPSDLAAVASGAAIDVTWSDNSAVEDGYVIQRATTEGYGPPSFNTFATIATVPANSAAFHDVSVSANTRYWYVVWAAREGAKAALSTTWTHAAISTTVPEAPVTYSVAPQSSSSVRFYAVPGSSTVADGFRLERSLDGVSGWTVAATRAQPDITDEGRQPEQYVCYRMIAFNAMGDSPPSSVACTTPPAAPSEVTVTMLPDGNTQVTWRDNSNVEDGYAVYFLYEVCDYEWYEPICRDEYASYGLEPNTTSLVSPYYRFAGMYAMKDGGSSDFVGPAGTSASPSSAALDARMSETRRLIESRRPPARRPKPDRR